MIQLPSLPDQGNQLPYFITGGADQMIRIFEYNLYQVAQDKDSEAAEKPDKSDSQTAASDDKKVDLPAVGDLKAFEQVSQDEKIK